MESPIGYHLHVTDADQNDAALYAKNLNAGANARALKVQGADADETIAMEVINDNAHADSRALKVTGKSEFDGDISTDGNVTVDGSLKIVAHGERGIYTTDSNPLLINTAAGNGEVVMGNGDDGVRISTVLKATGGLESGSNANDLELGTDSAAAGTKDVILSRTGRTTNVKGTLTVDENAILDANLGVDGSASVGGNLLVESYARIEGVVNLGTDAVDGQIDAMDPDDRDLLLGTDDEKTRNVILSRTGKLVKSNGNLVMQGNAVMLDSNTAPTSGAGMVFNAAGQVPPNPSIDFYIGGALVGFVDAVGGWQ